jgi:hypothetical protein
MSARPGHVSVDNGPHKPSIATNKLWIGLAEE